MPKENIWAPSPSDDDKLIPQVVWVKDCYVQVGIVPTSNPDAIGKGLFADLTRQQVNDLIRLLRRGRDQAYGRDE